MKVKSIDIYNGLQIINDLAEKPMKVGLIAKLLRLSSDLQKENEFIEKQRLDILKKYGKKDKNGDLIIENDNVSFNDEDVQNVQNELNELSNLEIDIIDRNITEEELQENNLELTLNQFSALLPFINK